MEETLKKLVEKITSGQENRHIMDLVVSRPHPHPTCFQPSMLTFPPRTETQHRQRLPIFEERREDGRNANPQEDISYKDYKDLRMRYSWGRNRGGYFNDDLRRKLRKWISLYLMDWAPFQHKHGWWKLTPTSSQILCLKKKLSNFPCDTWRELLMNGCTMTLSH